MKSIRLIIFTLFILIVLVGLKKDLLFNFSTDTKKEKIIKESARILNDCIDFKNKITRSNLKTIELIEYCLKEYGYKN
tara:strand:+ start:362 stop:595 length:234 start_codon:yes stop_codon:yes gene_type:complete